MWLVSRAVEILNRAGRGAHFIHSEKCTCTWRSDRVLGEPRQVGSAGAVRRRKCRPEVLAQRQGGRARAAGTPLCRLAATGRAALALGRKADAILRGGGARLKQQMYLYLPDPDQEIRRSKHRRLATRQEVLLWKSCSARPVFLRKLT